jgi:oligosaccharyltransferase complex subunit alpha (ribophorin I)
MYFAQILSLLLVALAHCAAFNPAPNWQNIEFKRSINLAKSYTKENYELTIKNIASSPVDEYYFALPNYMFDKLSGFTFSSSSSSSSANQSPLLTELVEESTEVNGEPLIKYIKVHLPLPIAPKSTARLLVDLIITDFVEPLPATIDIDDEQTLLLRTVKKPLSAYETISGTLAISGVSDAKELALEGQDIDQEGVVGDGLIKYEFNGPVKRFTISSLPLVYTHNTALTKITSLERNVWVSHWANSLQFDEFYKLTNAAASLKHGFSRADFMKRKQALRITHALTALEIGLTEDARDVYYTDLVGNVSTSRVFPGKVYIRPRYPIFGSWNYNFTVGWSNTLDDFLSVVKGGEDEYILQVPLLNGPNDATYDEVVLSFFLPEGAMLSEISSPIEYESLVEGNELSYFDMNKGHTKVSLTYHNLVDELRDLTVVVKYRYTTLNLLQKPLDIAKFVFIGLISYWLLTKIDISLKAKK